MGFVYFISLADKYVKIGYSQFPFRRFQEIQAYNPSDLSLLGMLPGNISLEKKLHKHFGEHRVRNEWFLLDEEIEEFVNENCEPVDAWEFEHVPYPSVGLSDFRQNLLPYLEHVQKTREAFIIERRGEALAAVIPIEDLKLLQDLDLKASMSFNSHPTQNLAIT